MFSPVHYAGAQPFNDWFAPDTTQRHALGLEVAAVDPYWGGAFFVYFKSNDAILKGSVVVLDETFTGVLLPSTVTQGFSFGVAMAPMAAGTYGWMQISGRAVYKTNATVAADGVLAIAAAGILGATATGKQVIGIRNRVSATGTVTFANTTTITGSSVLIVSGGYDGAFLGMALSGTGIPVSTVAAKLNPDGRTILMGSSVGVVDKLSTGSGGITMTGTYTGYGSGIINRPSCMQIVT
jgi:hypothetical protein